MKLLGGGAAEAFQARMWLAMRWRTSGVSHVSLRGVSPMESKTFNTGDVIFRQDDASIHRALDQTAEGKSASTHDDAVVAAIADLRSRNIVA